MVLELARRVQDLRRGLRDMVYSNQRDDKIMEKLDYSSRLLLAARSQKFKSTGIPIFAQPRFVGHNFAHEAVLWLYSNYRGFVLSNSADISLFLTIDVFQLDLSPCRARIRCLSLEVDLSSPYPRLGSLSRPRDDFAALSDLTKVHTHRNSYLAITLKSRIALCEGPILNLVARALEDMYPLVEELERRKMRVSIVMDYPCYGVLDVKHMHGSVNEASWCDLIGKNRVAMYSQQGFCAEDIEFLVNID
jgi:hypothetical protein